jgi:hypothetical protein
MSGLASLTANYTDSEDEDANKTLNDDEDTRDSVTFPSGPPSHLAEIFKSVTGTPTSDHNSAKSTPTTKKPPNLVSYVDEINEDKDDEPVPMDLESDASEDNKESEVRNYHHFL